MKAIQTRYAGCYFRSRLEARYAVLFDSLNIKWDYEPEGFDLNGVRYLPDFWLHIPGKDGWGYWVEIKPVKPSREEYDRLRNLSRASGHKAHFFIGTPAEDSRSISAETGRFFDMRDSAPITMCAMPLTGACVSTAIEAARSARFEFGESGARA